MQKWNVIDVAYNNIITNKEVLLIYDNRGISM